MVRKNLRIFLKGKAMTKTPEELTKEWKAGKLDLGYYYTKYKNRVIGIQNNTDDFFSQFMNPIIQVMAPVPSYEEYKAMQEQIADASKKVEELEEKIADQRTDLVSSRWYQTVQNEDIAELRGLLKEAADHILHPRTPISGFMPKCQQDLLIRINAAIGDNEIQANPVDNIKIQESKGSYFRMD